MDYISQLSQAQQKTVVKQRWFIFGMVVSIVTTAVYYSTHPYTHVNLSTSMMCDCNNPGTQSCIPWCEYTLLYHKNLIRTTWSRPPSDSRIAEPTERINSQSQNGSQFTKPSAAGINVSLAFEAMDKQPQMMNDSETLTESKLAINMTVIKPGEPVTEPCEDVIMPGGNPCEACLQGKQLITANRGWICGQTRLGNKMFMLLPAITAADQYNATFVLFQHDDDCEWIKWLQDIFEYMNSSTPLLSKTLTTNWTIIGEPGFTEYSVDNYKAGENYTFGGYRQSWHYLETKQQKRAARTMFKFTAKYEQYASRRMDMARREFTNVSDPLYVGVHMRIGDLLFDNARAEYGYQMAQAEYYEAAFDKAISDFTPRNIIFMVASDSLVEAKRMLTNIKMSVNTFLISGSAYQDFATLSKCNHSIISGGTYGFWAAWLAGGNTYYYADFAKPGSKFAEGFNNENFYPPEWIAVDIPEQNKTTSKSHDVTIPNNDTCDRCLANKQLVSIQKGWLCSSPRIGQKMFMLAPAVASTASHNTTLVFYQPDLDCDWIDSILDLFEQFNRVPLVKYSVTQKWENLAEGNSSSYNSDDLYVAENNFTFSGYRHNWKYVQTQRESDAVRKMFRFTAKYVNHAQQTIDQARQKFSNLTSPLIVGVHIRIGDLHQQEKIDYGYRMANASFYHSAITRATQTFSDRNILFLVTSDTMDEAKVMLGSLTNSYSLYFVSGSAFEDFALLSTCDHMIISGGAFGYWSAWLAGGKVFYFPDFAQKGSKFGETFHNEDFFRPDWIPVL